MEIEETIKGKEGEYWFVKTIKNIGKESIKKIIEENEKKECKEKEFTCDICLKK